MPDYLKALAAILLLGIPVLLLAKGPACDGAIAEEDYRRRRNLWIMLTGLAFLAHNFWLFMVVAGVLLLLAGRRDSNPAALFFFLLFALPPLSSEISGLGLARQFFALSYPRLLSLTVLLPAALLLFTREEKSEKSKWPDWLLAGYIALNLVLQLTVDSLTNTMRYGFYHFIDILLPYYVASRSLRSLRDFRDAAMSFVVAAMVLAAIGIFEYGKSWLLYASLDNLLGIDWNFGGYVERGESLRAVATTGQPIALGFVMAVACGLFLFLRPAVRNAALWLLGLGLLAAGLLAPLSRGPWLGAAFGFLAFIIIGPRPVESLMKLALAALIAVPLVMLSPLGDVIVERLPFMGALETDTITYRQRLLEMSLEAIRQNPWFGSFNFLSYLEDLRQGQGIIDIVNTYLGVALASGLAGLTLFVSFFTVIAIQIHRSMQARPQMADELRLLGRTLLATLIAVLIIIFTVSSITVIPVVYWSIAGLGLAYVRMLEKQPVAGVERLPIVPPRIAGLRSGLGPLR